MNIACPWCMWEPSKEARWACDGCGATFDTFETRARCPSCGKTWESTGCLNCGGSALHEDWYWMPRCPECGWKHEGTHRWVCPDCSAALDPFETGGVCPSCETVIDVACPACKRSHDRARWFRVATEAYEPERPAAPHEAIGGSPQWECPSGREVIPQDQLRWTFMRMAWLIECRGIQDLLSRPLVVPSAELLDESAPVPWESCERLFARLSALARIDSQGLRLTHFEEPKYSGGMYLPADASGVRTVVVGPGALQKPVGLCSMLCHEIAHDWLIHDVKVNPDPLDREALTDLAAVYLGFGCLTARAKPNALGARADYGRGAEYLCREEILIGLALFLAIRGEPIESVTKHLSSGDASMLERYAYRLWVDADAVELVKHSPSQILRGVEWKTREP